MTILPVARPLIERFQAAGSSSSVARPSIAGFSFFGDEERVEHRQVGGVLLSMTGKTFRRESGLASMRRNVFAPGMHER